jgi:tetratricopeptide (TPR) repeat protein
MKAADGLRRQTNVIYNKISWQRPKQPEDFLKAALSCYRQNRIDDAVSALEAGLNADPGAERLLATHLRICCEQDRLARVLDFINPTKKQLCETLARLDILDSSPVHGAIDHGDRPGPIWLTEDIINKNFHGQVFKLWCLADLLEHAGKIDISRKIHHKLSRLPTHDHDDYLYGGVSDMRLGNIEGGFQKIRLGIAAYPESEIIKSVYKDCCYSQLAFDHYLRLDSISGPGKGGDNSIRAELLSTRVQAESPPSLPGKIQRRTP